MGKSESAQETSSLGVVAKFFVVPETNMIRLGGGGDASQNRKSTDTVHMTCTSEVHACDFVVQHSKPCSFQREGRRFEYKMDHVRFGDDRKPLRRPLTGTVKIAACRGMWGPRASSLDK